MANIKVGYLLSYDYDMFLTSVRQLYNDVSKIVVGIDKNYKTWSGTSFIIPDSFFEEVARFDTAKKIEFLYDDFYKPELTPFECECLERNAVLKHLGKGGWKIQLDVDEYILNFSEIKKILTQFDFLTWMPKITPFTFKLNYATLFQRTPSGYLCIPDTAFPVITNTSKNTFARHNHNSFNYVLNATLMHQSWARSPEEILIKVKNWGHRDDFDTEEYLKFWSKVNEKNYHQFTNFHPISPTAWPSLEFIEGRTIVQFLLTCADKYDIKVVKFPFGKF
jgi:hypothetical protein